MKHIKKFESYINNDGEIEEFDNDDVENFLYEPLVDKIIKMIYGMTGVKIDKMVDNNDELCFDIAEGISQYIIDYNENKKHIHDLKKLLSDNNYKRSPLHSNYEDLSKIGKIVYNGLKEFAEQL